MNSLTFVGKHDEFLSEMYQQDEYVAMAAS